jgi:uncharacterized coiled-coil protein SlyX
MELIKLRVYNVGNKGSININPKLIETVIVSPYNDKYILTLTLSQGARYQLATSEGKYLFDTKEEAEAELNTILEEVSSSTDIQKQITELQDTLDLLYTRVENVESSKQDKLVAGNNITIDENNVISVSGVILDSELDAGEFGEAFTGELDAGEFGEAFTGELDAGEFI